MLSQEGLDQLKVSAKKIWSTYSDEYGYMTEKMLMVNRIKLDEDAFWGIWNMFDVKNKAKFVASLQPKEFSLKDKVVIMNALKESSMAMMEMLEGSFYEEKKE